MTAEVSALREGNLAVGTGEGAELGVLSEVVSKVAALFEHFIATFPFASEIELVSIWVLPGNFDGLIPGLRNALERLRQEVKDLSRALTRIRDDAHLLEDHLGLFLLHFLTLNLS